jgi:hypothetical protein
MRDDLFGEAMEQLGQAMVDGYDAQQRVKVLEAKLEVMGLFLDRIESQLENLPLVNSNDPGVLVALATVAQARDVLRKS